MKKCVAANHKMHPLPRELIFHVPGQQNGKQGKSEASSLQEHVESRKPAGIADGNRKWMRSKEAVWKAESRRIPRDDDFQGLWVLHVENHPQA